MGKENIIRTSTTYPPEQNLFFKKKGMPQEMLDILKESKEKGGKHNPPLRKPTILTKIGLVLNCNHIDHHSLGDCFNFYSGRWMQFFKNSLKIYSVVHVTISLLRLYTLRKKWQKEGELIKTEQKIKDLKQLLKRFVIGLVKSCVFTSTFASSIPFVVCYFNRMFGIGTSYSGFFASLIFSHAILFENPHRWGEISLYVLAQWFEGYFVNYWGKTKFLTRRLGQTAASGIQSKTGSKVVQVNSQFFYF